MMKLNQINNISFNGKIIDMHTHIGHWDNNKYFGKEALDTFTQTPIAVNINGIKSEDTIEKMIISSLDSIGTNGASGRSNEIEGLNQVLNLTKNNEKYSVIVVLRDEFDYSVIVNNKKADFSLRDKGIIEITLDENEKSAEIEIIKN